MNIKGLKIMFFKGCFQSIHFLVYIDKNGAFGKKYNRKIFFPDAQISLIQSRGEHCRL